ncbi:MAG: acyltransferase family protein [Acidobacteriaceae bacterium]
MSTSIETMVPPSGTEASRQIKKRNQTVDIVKGVAIILVVLGHVMQGMNHRQLLQGAAYYLSENFIYSFHMPAFFFVAGLFLDRSLNKRGPANFAREKLRTVLYPYFLWPLLTLPLLPWISRFQSGARPTVLAYLGNLLMGNSGWFLYTLFFILMLAVLTRRLPIWLRLALAVPLSYFWPNIGNHGIDGIFWEYIFVVTGQLVGARISSIERIHRWVAALACLALFSAIAAATLQYPAGLPRLLFIPLGLAGTAGLFFFAVSIPAPFIAKSLAWCGEASIAIYLLSPYFQGTVRQILFQFFHTTSNPVHIPLQTVAAVLFPALIYHHREFLHVEWFFKMPIWKQHAPRP